MIRNRLIYLALLVVLVLFFILYRGRLSLELLLFALILPVLLWLMTAVMRHTVKVSLRHTSGVAEKGEPFQWVLQIVNHSPFPSPHALVQVEYKTTLGDVPQPLTLRVPVLALNTGKVRMSFHAMTCGMMEMQVNALVLYDPLRLFHRTIRLGLKDRVFIAPEHAAVLPPGWEPDLLLDEESEEYSKEKPGDDPSEIFDLHDYRAGDAVSRIHWKLSSKLDSLLVKEYSLPLASAYLLLCDYRHAVSQPESAMRLDALLSAVCCCSAELTARGIVHCLLLYHPDTGCRLSDPISDADGIAMWMQHLLANPPLPAEAQAGFLAAAAEYLSGVHSGDRVMLFTPVLDEKTLDACAELEKPARLTAVCTAGREEGKRLSEMTLPFELVTVPFSQLGGTPVFLMSDPGEEADGEEAEDTK